MHYFLDFMLTHYLNLIFNDTRKLDWVKKDQAKTITKLIYNHMWSLILMRKTTKSKELVRPSITRFAINFLVLQPLIAQMDNLKNIVVAMNGMHLLLDLQA